jgi:hypothetical protein
MSPRVRTEDKAYIEKPNLIRTGVTRSHPGTYYRLILSTGHLSAQMSSGQDQAVICPNKRCDRVTPDRIRWAVRCNLCLSVRTRGDMLSASTAGERRRRVTAVGVARHLSAQMSSGQDKAVICPNKRSVRVQRVNAESGSRPLGLLDI